MHVRTPLRLAGLVAAGALTAASLTVAAPAANAAPVFTDAQTQLDPFADADTFDNAPGVDCDVTVVGGTEPSVPIVENGPAVSTSTSLSANYVDNNNPGDTGTATGSASATGKVTSAGGHLDTMDFTAQTTYTQSNVLPTSGCWRAGGAGVDLEFKFTVTQAGFLTLTTKNTGTAYGEVYLYLDNPAGDEPYFDSYGQGLKFNSSSKVYLAPGTYTGYFEGWSGRSNPGTRSGTTTVHGEFNVAGTQTEAQTGKGKKYVKMPTARNCAAGTLAPTVTDKKKRAKKVKVVKVFVNDSLVKKFRTPKKGAALTVPVAADQAADVTVEVTTKPRKLKNGKKKPGKVYETSASYEACS